MQQPRSKLTSVWPASGSPFVATSNPSSVVCLNQFSNQGRYTHLFGEFECSKWTVAVANITYALSDDSIRLCIQINKFLGALDTISLAISPSSVTWHLDSVGFNQKDYLFFPINTERFFFIEVNENANVMKTYFDLILLASVFPSRIIMCSFSCVFVIQPSYQFYLAVPCVHSMLLSLPPPFCITLDVAEWSALTVVTGRKEKNNSNKSVQTYHTFHFLYQLRHEFSGLFMKFHTCIKKILGACKSDLQWNYIFGLNA